jgi:O-acetyl-ADP-ribose deacetylase (regulator of RNase III)
MISYVKGDLFESPAQTLVNTVNTAGVMGKGIASRFKRIYPDMFKEYQKLCEEGKLTIGRLHLYRTPHKLLLNFPTKIHWRQPSQPEFIRRGLETFRRGYRTAGIHSIAFPPLGCGNGELDFYTQVEPIMREFLRDLPIQVYVYAPRAESEPPEHQQIRTIERWLREYPGELPFSEVWQDLRDAFKSKRALRTLAQGKRFEAALDIDAGAIRIQATGRTIVVREDELKELWLQLRDGILSSSTIPATRKGVAPYILSLFTVLPYVRTVTISDDLSIFESNPEIGIQLRPVEATPREQGELALAT